MRSAMTLKQKLHGIALDFHYICTHLSLSGTVVVSREECADNADPDCEAGLC